MYSDKNGVAADLFYQPGNVIDAGEDGKPSDLSFSTFTITDCVPPFVGSATMEALAAGDNLELKPKKKQRRNSLDDLLRDEEEEERAGDEFLE